MIDRSAARPAALSRENLVLTRALDAVRSGDLDAAQELLDRADGVPLTLAQVFRLYQTELEAQAEQLRDSQVRTEQALDWFTNLFRTLPVAALLVDGHGLITDANAQALEDLALGAALRSLPVPLRRLVASTEVELRLAALWPALRVGGTEALDDVPLRALDGQARWADLRITLVPARQGGPNDRLYLCVLSDRTARVEAQRAREQAAAAEHQRDLAQSANQAKTELLSRVSHELRTPLNAVIGFSDLMLMDPAHLDAGDRKRLGLIRSAGQHLLALVDEVLQINRTEAGALPLDLGPVPLRALVSELLSLQEPMTQMLHLRLSLDAPADGAAVGAAVGAAEVLAHADARRVREVLTNLLTNAVKYNRQGGWIRAAVGVRAGRACVEISDGGIGMTTEQLAHLYEPFNRLGAERLGVGGHGLGLSIARTLAQAMGGALQAESVPGEGSRFLLELPLHG